MVEALLAAHPGWLRARGAVGQSNQAMVDRAFEQQGTVIRVPTMTLDGLAVQDVGLLGSGPPGGGMVGRLFWNAWEKGAAGPVVGWLGGNVLSRYRLTIDYRNHVSYWRQTAPARTDELDAVGISLIHTATEYRVGGLVQRDGVAPVTGVEIGDRLVAIDGQDAASMSRGALLAALHGRPGEPRRLTLDRGGQRMEADAAVGAFGP